MSTQIPDPALSQAHAVSGPQLPGGPLESAIERPERRNLVSTSFGLGLLLLTGLCLVSVLLLLRTHGGSHLGRFGGILASLKEAYKYIVPLGLRLQVYSFRARFLQTFGNPYYYLGVAAVFTLEWLFPAKEEQGIFHVGLVQDVLYLFLVSVVIAGAAGPYIGYLDRFYANHLAFLTIQPAASWPFPVRAVFGLVLNDLLHWTHHYLRHRVRPLWFFHMIHHSQRQMNLFADVRSHFVETFFALSIVFIPLNMFSVSFANRGWIYFIPVLYFRLYHANIRTNFGLLRYILVTPQSHRIHHSIEPKHWDKNFGFIFTIWDHVFGTQYKKYDEYPDTGVNEVEFPIERSYTGVVNTLFRQIWYPFRQLLQYKA